MKEKKAAKAPEPAAAPAAKRRKSGGAGGGRAPKRARDDKGDLISDLPDDILGTIISLLPTKYGARTQVLARRWRPLWRSAPLNIDSSICDKVFQLVSVVSKVLSDHPGPSRRFSFKQIRLHKDKKRFTQEAAQIESWFQSRALDDLQELEISFDLLDHRSEKRYPLPPSVLRCASTLVVAKIGYCDFPKEIAPSMSFPLLKQLNLWRVSISQDALDTVLSACHVLESLDMGGLEDVGCFRVSSPTLRSVSLRYCFKIQGELIIEDAPLLERLLLPYPEGGGDSVRVIRAPKLQILGLLSPRIPEIKIGNLVLQGLTPTNLRYTISTVKVLVLQLSVLDLTAVIDVLRCFPCLETLYVRWDKCLKIPMKDKHEYDPLDPLKSLETHLKTLVVMDYKGDEPEVGFAKFFILNAKVLREIKFRVNERINKECLADQYRLLEMETRASQDAQLKFIRCDAKNAKVLDTHDLSTADPFSCYLIKRVDALSKKSY